MKNITSLIKVALCALGLSFAMGSQAQSVNTSASATGTTIVQSFEPAAGKNAADVYKAMMNMVTAIRKMPGLVDDVVLENKNPANKPTHVHVMRWKDQKSWEAMFSNAEFQKTVKENVAYFKVDAANIFVPVK